MSLHYNIDADAYHSQSGVVTPRLSYSVAKLIIKQSPYHAWYSHPKLGGGGRETTAEMEAGSIAHKLLLGKGADIAIGEWDDWKKKEAREFRDEARANRLLPVLACKLEAIEAMVEAVTHQIQRSEAADFFSSEFDSEVCALWQTEADSGDIVECQSMFDRLNVDNGKIYDLKFTTSAHDRAVAAKINDMGYDIQEAFYTKALETLVPSLAGRIEFVFIFVESVAPHRISLAKLSGMNHSIGMSKVERAINKWSECLGSGMWPGYSPNIISVDPPPWALAAEMNDSDYD
jgi:hypothetical protein